MWRQQTREKEEKEIEEKKAMARLQV